MGRKKDDKIWQEFVQMGGVSKCKHCEAEFKGKPSVSRLRKHLLGDKGGGISVCTKVPDHVKAALLDDSEKRRRIEPTQINIGVENSSSTSSQQQSQHFEQVVLQEQRMQEAVQDEGGEMDQYQMLENMFRQGIDELGDLGIHDGVFGSHENRGEALFINELVGQEFEVNIKRICSSLMKEEVFSIGIYGMGGVGKTELAKHVHNKLLQDSNFRHVYWVEVTQDFSIRNMQNAIAKAVNLNLTNEDAEHKRVVRLQKELIQNKPFVLILDDVWSCIYSEEVGIPINLNGCKLVLTTRSQDICQKMRCQEIIQVHCLQQSLHPTHGEEIGVAWELAEDWELFTKILSPKRSLLPIVEEIAKSIVWHYGGLPLMIKCMARVMVGVDEIYEWRSALEAMKESKWNKNNYQVFECLKRSYDHLQDPTLQQCFLYIAMLEDLYLDKEEIIEHLIAEGIIDGERSREAKVSEGYALLNKLEKLCLSTYHNNIGFFDMHRLVGNMALQIMKEESIPSLVMNVEGSEYLPDKRHWTNDLVRVSLSGNEFEEIYSGHLPKCPNLSTLILCHNYNLHSIEDSFFSQLPGLKVLDLSSTAIETLPESIGGLQNLTALFLRRCKNLREMPSLVMLRSLKMLDLYRSRIGKVPQGLERLSNLKYLNLFGTEIEEFPEEILTNLTHVQFLSVDSEIETTSTQLSEELTWLLELETLSWRFNNFQEFKKYVDFFKLMSTMRKRAQLKHCYLSVGPPFDEVEGIPIGQKVVFSCCVISERVILLDNVEELTMDKVSIEDGRGLCLENAIGLKYFEISDCEGIEYLFSLCSSTSIFQSLQTVCVSYLYDLQVLFGAEVATTTSCPHGTPFSNLRSFTIESCPRMKKLFPFALLGNLQNLGTLEVKYCDEMEEIIAAKEELGHTTRVRLPKLRHLELWHLPNLKKVCGTQLECNSLQEITIIECKDIVDVPISLPLQSLQKLQVLPKEWWASASWGHLDQKNALKPQFNFG